MAALGHTFKYQLYNHSRMSTETATTPDRQHVGLGTLAKRGLVAVVVADAVNVVVTFTAITAGIASNLDPLSYGPVLFFTTIGMVGATLVYGVLDRFLADPDRTFAVVAAVVLVLSWIPDATVVPAMPGGTAAGAAVLALMHLSTAVVAVVVLTDRYGSALPE